MKTTSTFEVGGCTYAVNMWHPDKAMENLAWLTKTCGESITAIISSVDSLQDILDTDVDLKLLTPAVKAMLLNIKEKEVVQKVRSFTEAMECDGAKVDYDTHFMGRPGHLLKVVVGVLKVQYSDFFADIPAGIMPGKNQTAGQNSTPAS